VTTNNRLSQPTEIYGLETVHQAQTKFQIHHKIIISTTIFNHTISLFSVTERIGASENFLLI
jgi:hypothetical protein